MRWIWSSTVTLFFFHVDRFFESEGRFDQHRNVVSVSAKDQIMTNICVEAVDKCFSDSVFHHTPCLPQLLSHRLESIGVIRNRRELTLRQLFELCRHERNVVRRKEIVAQLVLKFSVSFNIIAIREVPRQGISFQETRSQTKLFILRYCRHEKIILHTIKPPLHNIHIAVSGKRRRL